MRVQTITVSKGEILLQKKKEKKQYSLISHNKNNEVFQILYLT